MGMRMTLALAALAFALLALALLGWLLDGFGRTLRPR
jgi:hypothetical protein